MKARGTAPVFRHSGRCWNSIAPDRAGKLAREQQEQDDTTRWIELIKEYADIRELDAATLQRLIRKIVIHEDMDGTVIRQTVEIYFNFMNHPDKYKLIRE